MEAATVKNANRRKCRRVVLVLLIPVVFHVGGAWVLLLLPVPIRATWLRKKHWRKLADEGKGWLRLLGLRAAGRESRDLGGHPH